MAYSDKQLLKWSNHIPLPFMCALFQSNTCTQNPINSHYTEQHTAASCLTRVLLQVLLSHCSQCLHISSPPTKTTLVKEAMCGTGKGKREEKP